jgi:hypothetical protein
MVNVDGVTFVKVGPEPDDVLPLKKAEGMLAKLLEVDAELFSYLAGSAMGGVPPRKPRMRAPA